MFMDTMLHNFFHVNSVMILFHHEFSKKELSLYKANLFSNRFKYLSNIIEWEI